MLDGRKDFGLGSYQHDQPLGFRQFVFSHGAESSMRRGLSNFQLLQPGGTEFPTGACATGWLAKRDYVEEVRVLNNFSDPSIFVASPEN
mmetsp:Transcript_42834/g.118404  ORF Transcript_42834/g.118404 Transcript_42834/m.118404 type:complete len:89 (+) Transcript_42834:3422-3688(+)